MFYNIKFSLKTNKIKNLKEDYFVMNQETEVTEKQDVVIRFSGDSGDGMQLTGQQFSDTAALFGMMYRHSRIIPQKFGLRKVRSVVYPASRFILVKNILLLREISRMY